MISCLEGWNLSDTKLLAFRPDGAIFWKAQPQGMETQGSVSKGAYYQAW